MHGNDLNLLTIVLSTFALYADDDHISVDYVLYIISHHEVDGGEGSSIGLH